MILPHRYAAYLGTKPSGRVILELAVNGRCVVLPVPLIRRPFMWARGFVLEGMAFWLFRGMEAHMFLFRPPPKPRG